ncbi:MAG: hypothetical protein KBA96_03270 [Rhodocyclaceae bacterium]|nr:hypothetical protein [Rhodocyclaceae bacterium]
MDMQEKSEDLNEGSEEIRFDDALGSNSSKGHPDSTKKPQRRFAPPAPWPKIPEGAAGTAAAFGAWKTVTHSGRKI